MFLSCADDDSKVEALIKVHECRHAFMRRPCLKAGGMPGSCSPDFVLRTAEDVYIVETKAQAALSDENAARKQRSALSWVEQVASLLPEKRFNRRWHYVFLGESTVYEWNNNNARATELLEFARLRPATFPQQQPLDMTY